MFYFVSTLSRIEVREYSIRHQDAKDQRKGDRMKSEYEVGVCVHIGRVPSVGYDGWVTMCCDEIEFEWIVR